MRLKTVLLTLALATTAFADPRMWEPSGKMIRGEAPVRISGSVTNDAGLTLVVWVDYETGKGDIWGQLLDVNGNPMWGSHGRRIVATVVSENVITAYAWQESFALCFSRGNSHMNGSDLFMLAIDTEGNPSWLQNGGTGVQVSHEGTGDGRFHKVKVLDDGVIAYAYGDWDAYGESFILYANRVGTDGELILAEPMLLLPEGDLGTAHGIDFDEEGAVYLGWNEFLSLHTSNYHKEKFSNSGEILWEQVNFVETDSYEAIVPLHIANEGCYFAWAGDEFQPNALKMQLYDADGDGIWPLPVILVSDWSRGSGLRLLPNDLPGDASGVILSWTRRAALPDDSGAVVVQRVNAEGNRTWGADGIELCGGAQVSTTTSYSIKSDGAGGVLASLQLYLPNGEHYAYQSNIVHLNSIGDPVWGEPCGIIVSSLGTSYSMPALATGGVTFTLASWHEYSDTNIVRTIRVNEFSGDTTVPAGGGVWAGGLSGSISYVSSVPLTNNRAAVVWSDSRAHPNAYFQILHANGQTDLEEFGRPIFSDGTSSNTIQMDVCSGGDAGFYAVKGWDSDETGYLRLARVRSDGSIFGDVLVNTVQNDYPGVKPRCVASTDNGCIVVWQARDGSDYGYDLKVALYDSSLSPQWSSPLLIGSDGSTYYLNDVVATPNGGCAVVWSPSNDIRRVTYIQASGQVGWETDITNTADSFEEASATIDESGNICVAWLDDRVSWNHPDVYGQKISAEGDELLTAGGVRLASATSSLMLRPLSLLWENGFWLVYARDTGGYDNALYANRYDANFVAQLNDSGVALSTNQERIFRYSAITDGESGLIAAWGSEPEFGDGSVAMVKHLNASGEFTDPYWAGNGGIICDTLAKQYAPVVARGASSDEFYCFWGDYRTSQQVFGQYIDETPTSVIPPHVPIVSEISLSQNYPNPFNAITEIVFSLPRAMNAKLKIYDVTGRLVRTLVDEQFASGEHRVAFDARDVASGVYFYELRAGDVKVARKMLLLK